MRSFFMRFPGGKPKAMTFSYDDGVHQDRRLVEIFTRHGMKATFNWMKPGFSKEEAYELFLSKGHEIAVHGFEHRANGNTRPIEGIRDVLDCRLALEDAYGCIIRGMAYPDTGINQMGNFGTYEAIKQYLGELDVAYARTLGGDNNRFLMPTDFHAWMPSVYHTNPKLLEYADDFLNLDLSVKKYHAMRFPRLFYVWGHSYEFDRDDNWELIETLCEKMANNEEIWYATNIEIYDYTQAYKSLRYSADGRIIYNPTLYTIWFDADGVLYNIKPGQTLTLPTQKERG